LTAAPTTDSTKEFRLVPALDSRARFPTLAPWVLSVWLAFHDESADFPAKNVLAVTRVEISLADCVVNRPPYFTLSAMFHRKTSKTPEMQETQQKRP
jgi:hypothetical protein